MKCLPALFAALLLTSCGGSATSSSGATGPASSSPSTPTSNTTAPSAGSATTTGPSTTRTASKHSGSARCRSRDLAMSFLGQQGATSHGELGFALRNVGAASCRTYGYPGILFLGRSRQALPTIASRTSHDFFGTAPAASLVVNPGRVVSFRIGVTHGAVSSARCTTAYGLQVIAPDDTEPIRTSIPDGAYECGTATVSPLQPGTSAYP